MLLSSFYNKKIYEHGQLKGVCDGVFLSKKSHALKALSFLCDQGQFCLSFSQVDYVTDSIRLTKYASCRCDNYDKFFPMLPVYDEGGAYRGKAIDVEIQNGQAVHLFLDDGSRLPAPLITSCKDAVIVKKQPPFPLFSLVPAPEKPLLEAENAPSVFVTKHTLSTVIKKGKLIRFTLSLLSSDGVFCREF